MNFNRTNHHRSLCALSACLIAIFGLNPSVNAVNLRVATNGSCTGDGSGWNSDAFKYLQDALDAAVAGDQIWVRAGTYYVDQSCANEDGSGDRDETFQLVKDVFLLGGFDGTELFASERDSVANPTFLSGAIAQGQALLPCALNSQSCFEVSETGGCLFEIDPECCDRVCYSGPSPDPYCCVVEWDIHCVDLALDRCGGSYHVVTAGNEIDDPEKTAIDGFTIRDGTANGTQNDRDNGGGMLIKGEPSVVRCTFTSNTARGLAGLPSVEGRGGGMSINGNFKQPWIINCIFEDNPGDQALIPIHGGGLASSQADPILTNCLFVGNAAQQNGGGLYNLVGTCPTAPPGEACGWITLINGTVYGNTADTGNTGFTGGGLYFDGNAGQLDADNTIVWGNLPVDDQIDGVGPAVFDINYTDCDGGCPSGPGGTGNLNVTPLFAGAPGDLRLTIDSLCIDAGNPLESIIPCDFFNLDNDDYDCTPLADEATPDLDLFNRVLDGDDSGGARVDMGSYEYPALCPMDLDDDGMVGVGDLLILLANWGDPYGVPDLLAMLAAWGACPTYSVEPLSIAEELEDACLTQDHWDDFVDVMTDPESSEEDKDRYNCWMTHYLDHCPKCTCTHIPTCPGPDPFT